MEHTRFINEFYPLSTKVGESETFKADRSKELKGLKEVNLELEGVTQMHPVKVIKITKAKVQMHEESNQWHFSAKVVLRLAD